MNISPTQPKISETIELSPSFNIPVVLLISAIPCFFVQPIVSGTVALFGLFLMIQAVLIKLKFTDKTLEVYRGEKLIRSFPYSQWQNWEIYWQPLPVLFYFKEVNSIHFLPIIFDAKTLKICLENYFPKNS